MHLQGADEWLVAEYAPHGGVSFDLTAQPEDVRIGMRERALAVGGELVVVSAPGRGTVLRVCIPVAAEQEEEL